MATTTLIIGESGSGKSTSLRTLDPYETFIVNVIGKPLPFKGFSKFYSSKTEEDKKVNYYVTDNAQNIKKVVQRISQERDDITNIIIDDFQYVMANEFMRKSLERGYDKFTEIGKNAWEIISCLSSCRDNINCFVLSHSDSDANGKIKCKTIGKMLDDKISLEGMFTTVLHAIIHDGKHIFLTQHDGSYLAKSPMGMFESKTIDNDLNYVIKKMNEYYDVDLIQ